MKKIYNFAVLHPLIKFCANWTAYLWSIAKKTRKIEKILDFQLKYIALLKVNERTIYSDWWTDDFLRVKFQCVLSLFKIARTNFYENTKFLNQEFSCNSAVHHKGQAVFMLWKHTSNVHKQTL